MRINIYQLKLLRPGLRSLLLLVCLHLKSETSQKSITLVVIIIINYVIALDEWGVVPVAAACWLAAEAFGVVAMGVWPAGPEVGLSPFSSGAGLCSFLRSAPLSASSWISAFKINLLYITFSLKKQNRQCFTSVCISSSPSSRVRAASCLDLCSRRLTYRIGLDRASITSGGEMQTHEPSC